MKHTQGAAQEQTADPPPIAARTDTERTVICKHCRQQIDQVNMTGISLLCPLCGKPQNGQQHHHIGGPDTDMIVICKHCGKAIEQAQLRGMSLICPSCGRPQNGQSHPQA